MTGRGRPRKTKSPDAECVKRKTRPDDFKEVPQPRCPDFTEEKQNETAKKQTPKKREQKNPNNAVEKPSPESTIREKTTNHFTEINKQQCTPTDSTEAKTCADRTKSTAQLTMMTKKDSPKTTRAKKCSGREKSQERLAEEVKPETPKGTRKPKTCVRKAKSPEESIKTLEMPPGNSEYFQKDMTEEKAAIDYILNETLKNMKIKRNDRSNAAQVINAIVQNIIKHLKENTKTFKEVQEPLHTGSYYENLKICNPDEFDVMVPMLVERVNIKPFGEDGAFYSVALKRDRNPLMKFQEDDILSASKMLSEFRDEVKKCVKRFTEWEVEKKKKGCPAVTLTTKVQSVPISLDVVLCLMVKSSWPLFTNEGLKIVGWLGTKVRQEYRRMPYYLVPKYEGKGMVEKDSVLTKDAWRVSFSHVEKAILKNHGSEKTCCEKAGERCCRKSCLKLLKHLLNLLKERNPSLNKFCSYHAKTTLLHACCLRPKDRDWRESDLSHCFQLFLEDFKGYLENGELQNFFIPSQNLLSGPGNKACKILSDTIREECQKGFPIFKQQL